MLAENATVTVSICFFSHPILASFCSYLPGRITSSDNYGDTCVRPHCGDDDVLRLRQAFSGGGEDVRDLVWIWQSESGEQVTRMTRECSVREGMMKCRNRVLSHRDSEDLSSEGSS